MTSHRASSGGSSDRVGIVELSPGRRRDRARFVALPFVLGKDVAAWQPGLRMIAERIIHPTQNPYWAGRHARFFVAVRGGQVVGRVGVLAPGEIPQRPTAAVLMFPDFVDDRAVVAALIEAARGAARGFGADELVGPLNPNIHHDLGIQVSGFDRRNAVLMGYQPAYYAPHLEALGCVPLHEFQAWELYQHTFRREGRLARIAERIERRPALRIRGADLGRFDEELELLFHLYSDSFADHWGFTRPTRDEFRFLAGDLRALLRRNLVLIAEWNGRPVGFVLAIPDVHAILPKGSGRVTPSFLLRTISRWRRIELVRVMIAGVLPGHRAHGIHLPLFHRIACEVFAQGYRGGEISWVMNDNTAMRRALELLGATPTKTYRLYAMDLRP